jgi:hypothetical protein
MAAYRAARANGHADLPAPPLWDGRAAERITACLLEAHAQHTRAPALRASA